MNILFNCSNCSQEMSIDRAAVGMEIDCPTCGLHQMIPDGKPDPEGMTDAEKAAAGIAGESSNEEDKPRKLAVPIRTGSDAPQKPLEQFDHKGILSKAELERQKEEARKKRGGKKGMLVKTIRRVNCLEMNLDHFDEVVGEFLDKIDEKDIISINPTSYSHADSQGKIFGDYGVMIVYKG